MTILRLPVRTCARKARPVPTLAVVVFLIGDQAVAGTFSLNSLPRLERPFEYLGVRGEVLSVTRLGVGLAKVLVTTADRPDWVGYLIDACGCELIAYRGSEGWVSTDPDGI